MGVKLLIIDPQMDFMDHPSREGSLRVIGAHADMLRLARLIREMGDQIDEIYITLDSHKAMDIAHPSWWMDESGSPPPPFTEISHQDAASGKWIARNPQARDRSVAYLKELEASGRKTHRIWPEHCLTGSEGQRVHPELFEALMAWERLTMKSPVWVSKGENPFTESFSGFKSEVPDPSDESTLMNTKLAELIINGASEVLIAGEALSHCVADSVRDLAECVGGPRVSKLTLLTDATSPVDGCESLGEAFISELRARGMAVKTTEQIAPVKRARLAV